MPWKVGSVMDERLRFVARLLEGEQMSVLCREFGISRKTGYKIFDRYQEHGLEAFCRQRYRMCCRWRHESTGTAVPSPSVLMLIAMLIATEGGSGIFLSLASRP